MKEVMQISALDHAKQKGDLDLSKLKKKENVNP